MSKIEWLRDPPCLGGRLTNSLLRATRARQPLDVADPAALVAARAKLDAFDAFTARLRPAKALPYHDSEARLAGVDMRELTIKAPAAPQSDRLLLFIHGGGFFFRALHGHLMLAARIAQAAGIGRALLPLYRLAPEHAFPAAQDDCLAIYQGLIASGVAAGQIVICADSAGGALALGMLTRARDAGLAMPRALALMSPMTDLSYSGPSIEANADLDPMLGGAAMPVPRYYLGARDPSDPACSPLFADLKGLPPMLVQVGSTERLLDDSLRLAEPARAGDVDITVEVWRDMPHVFQAYDFRRAREARARIAAFLRQA